MPLIGYRAWRVVMIQEKDVKATEWEPVTFCLASTAGEFFWLYPIIRNKKPPIWDVDAHRVSTWRARRSARLAAAQIRPCPKRSLAWPQFRQLLAGTPPPKQGVFSPFMGADPRRGLYFGKSLAQMEMEFFQPAYGECTLFGRVIEHTNGFRAQNCRIDKIYLRQTAVMLGNVTCSSMHWRHSRGPVIRVQGRHIRILHPSYVFDRGGIGAPKCVSQNVRDIIRDTLEERYQCEVLPFEVGGPS